MKKLRRIALMLLLAVLCFTAGILALSMRFPIRHMDIITAHAGGLEPSLILAVIMAESSFDPYARSHAGAQGLMQLMPPTAADMAQRMGLANFEPYHVWNPEVNIAMGAFYLNLLKARYDGNLDLMLAAYNAGLGNVDRWLANPDFSRDGQTLDTIPFPETENYLRRIRQFQRIYRILLTLRRANQ